MPAYNAEKTLEQTYAEIPREIVDEVILTDDCSRDGTVEKARELGIKEVLIHPKNRGYGGNQKTCYNRALELGADIVIMLHPDYQYTPKLIEAMAYIIANDVYPVVFGSRILGKGALKGGMPLIKYIANRFLTFTQNVLINQKLSEYHTGYRAFSADVLRKVDYNACSDDFILDNEMLDVKEFLVRFANAIRRFTKDENGLRGKWQEMEERSNLLEELAVLGFTDEKLREIQQKTERQEYDVLDITLDLVYAVAPIKRAMRAERLAEKLALLTPQQRALAEVILRNYVNDGVWTLSMKGFSDLLKQRYGSISEALSKLSFPTLDHALNYYSDIQHWLYAA